jgi:hypothetical protein
MRPQCSSQDTDNVEPNAISCKYSHTPHSHVCPRSYTSFSATCDATYLASRGSAMDDSGVKGAFLALAHASRGRRGRQKQMCVSGCGETPASDCIDPFRRVECEVPADASSGYVMAPH